MIKNNKRITFCFDLDNIICKTNNSDYKNSKPYKKVIRIINKLYNKGNTIKIFTARYMGRNNENVSMLKKKNYKKTFNQLKSWKLKFNILILGKPSYDVYIDDKQFGFKKNWLSKFKKQYL